MPPELAQEMTRLDAVLVPKALSPLMRALALVLGRGFLTDFWTTWRAPFQRSVRIGYPDTVTHPEEYAGVIVHELVHAAQFRPWWGPLWVALLAALLPLPVLFSGRWFVERHAYLLDIRDGRHSVDGAVYLLWHRYGWAWPPGLMRRWFERQLRGSP